MGGYFIKIVFSTVIVASCCISTVAQELAEILTILGIQEEELLSEQEIERFESLLRNPVEINLASRPRLLAAGLFSQYQIASLIDYRSTYGDILSIEELSVVDGFDKSLAQALSPFVSLYSDTLPGATGKNVFKSEVSLRTTWKPDLSGSGEAASGSYVAKGRIVLDCGSRASAAVTGSSLGNGNYAYSFHGTLYGRRHLERLVVGDFNARFGQGLTLWSGFSLSGMAAPSSLYRRPMGISPSSSYSRTGLRGVALSATWGRLVLSTMTAVSMVPKDGGVSLTPGLNIGYLMKHGQVSVTGLGGLSLSESGGITMDLMKVGMDVRFCIRGTDLFGEVGTDLIGKSVAGLGGAVFKVGESSRIGFMGRYYPTNYSKLFSGAVRTGTYARDEGALSLSFERKGMILSTDFSRRLSDGRNQCKLLASDEVPLGGGWSLKPRLSVRYRHDLKTEIRMDICRNVVPWTNTVRLDWLRYLSDAFLAYYELGYKRERFSAFFRATAFRVDKWDDRIYSYERDAPGNFNVPAYYGRGFSLNLTGSWKQDFRKGRTRLYWGIYYKDTEKPDSSVERTVGLKFQAVLSF